MEDMLKKVSENYAKNMEELLEGVPEGGIFGYMEKQTQLLEDIAGSLREILGLLKERG